METDIKEIEKGALVMRLERNQKDLSQLKSKLNSYICEPKTPSLFERIENLKSKLENLSVSNSEIITSIRGRNRATTAYLNSAKEQLIKFNKLQQGIEEYIVHARNC